MILLRALAFNLYFVILTLLMGIGALPIRLSGNQARKQDRALRYAQRWTAATLKGLQHICGITLEITGQEHLTGTQPCLIASQHQSAYDTLVWMNLVPRPAYIMKQELLRLPLVGPMLLLSGMIPIERLAGAKALRSLLRHTEIAIADNRQIIIFPEGTRTAPGERVKLQPGIVAMAKHAPTILPIATNSGLFWGRNAFLKRPGTLRIVIGPPIQAPQGRTALTDAIQHAWDELASTHSLFPRQPHPVDNSVGIHPDHPQKSQ